jgi:hypothetical protein
VHAPVFSTNCDERLSEAVVSASEQKYRPEMQLHQERQETLKWDTT